MSSTTPIISDDLFKAANTWSPGSISPVTDGKRYISGEMLSPSDSGYGSGSSTSSTALLSQLQVPLQLESVETMTWIGFDRATGDHIMNEYLTDMDGSPLQRHIEDHLRYHKISENCNNTSSGNWNLAMTQLGISAKMQQSVMDSDFGFVRSWHPLRYWLEVFIVGNYLSLASMEKRARAIIQQSQSGIPQLRGGAGEDGRADYFTKKAGYTTLYRATIAGNLKKVFLDDDKVDLSGSMSRPKVASDFGYEANGSFSYWTPNEWVAELYGKYCERNINNKYDVCIIKLVARAHDIEIPGKTWRLSYGDDWRKLVWHSRTQKIYPEELRNKYEATRIFIGPLSVDATPKFTAMSTWKDVTEANVCRRNYLGEEAVQYAFRGPTTMFELGNKAEIDLFRFHTKKRLADPKTWVAGR